MLLQKASVVGPTFWGDRLRAAGVHLGLSLAVSAVAAGLVFGLWYPYPYREISGGRELFVLLVSVDVVVGPLITLVVYSKTKPWTVMRRDLAVVGVLQLMALAYGLWTVFLARPVHLVFEYNRFAVVHSVDIPPEWLNKAPTELRSLPLWGPTTLSLRPFKNANEQMEATLAALSGAPLSTRPELWQSYAAGKTQVLAAARSVEALISSFPTRRAAIDLAVAQTGRTTQALVYLPMRGRNSFWTVLLDPATADVLAFLPLDPY